MWVHTVFYPGWGTEVFSYWLCQDHCCTAILHAYRESLKQGEQTSLPFQVSTWKAWGREISSQWPWEQNRAEMTFSQTQHDMRRRGGAGLQSSLNSAPSMRFANQRHWWESAEQWADIGWLQISWFSSGCELSFTSSRTDVMLCFYSIFY